MSSLTAKQRLIVALDVPSAEEAWALVSKLDEAVEFYKVGWRLFLAAGMGLVEELKAEGYNVFLDLKMDDIGETIQTAVEVIAGKVDFLTLQGGTSTIRAAKAGRGDKPTPGLLSVTFLSSQNVDDLSDVYGIATGGGQHLDFNAFLIHRAKMALDAGADGWIASGSSIGLLRDRFGKAPTIVTPGIRPSGSSADDHKRSLTPGEAIRMGADYLVVGRPIRSASDPKVATLSILKEIEEAANPG